MSQSELYEKGAALRAQVVGTPLPPAGADVFSRTIDQYVTENCWGELWSRPGIDPKLRVLLNLSMLAATLQSAELTENLHAAVTQGVSKEEILEIFLQVAMYCGAPTAVEAFKCARTVFAERGL